MMQRDGLDTWKTVRAEYWTGKIDREACRDRKRLDRWKRLNLPESFLPSSLEAVKRQIGLSAWPLWLEIKLSHYCLEMPELCPVVEILPFTHQLPNMLVQLSGTGMFREVRT